MNKKLVKQIILAIIGAIFLGAGIGMGIKIGIGVSPLDVLTTAVSKLSGLTVGTVTSLFNVIFTILTIFIYKKNVGIATFIFILVSKFPIDFFATNFVTTNSLIINILLCVFANVVLALGSEIFISSRLGASAYDAFTMSFGKLFKHEIKYVYIRWTIDAICAIIGFILGGDIGIGTIISLLVVGPAMRMWQPLVGKVTKQEMS